MKWPSCFVCLNLFIFPPCQHGVVGRVKESFTTTMTMMSEGNSKLFASWQKHNILWRYRSTKQLYGYLEVYICCCVSRFNKMETLEKKINSSTIIGNVFVHFNKPTLLLKIAVHIIIVVVLNRSIKFFLVNFNKFLFLLHFSFENITQYIKCSCSRVKLQLVS